MPGLTLEDIAKKAGVSRSTVSRVINNHPNVSEDVRLRVQEVIQSTGFHPNAAARTLASQRSWMIGVILPRSVSSLFTDPYYPRLIQGIASACNQNNYTLSLFLVGKRDDEEIIFPRVARKGFLDGLIIQAGHIGDRLIDSLLLTGIPMIVSGRPHHTSGVSYVDVDNIEASKSAVRHLLGLGYKRIATITGPSNSTVGMDRLEGYKQALIEHDIPVDPSLIAEGYFTEDSGYLAMKKLLPANPRAVFAASDLTALGAIRAVNESGLRVPDDVAFVGYDDLPLPTKLDPELTTVSQPVKRLGERAVNALIDIIENGTDTTRTIIMDTKLVIRQSCGASTKKGGSGD